MSYIASFFQVLKAQGRARSRGFSDVLYLNSVDKRNLEEASSCNIFIVKVCRHADPNSKDYPLNNPA